MSTSKPSVLVLGGGVAGLAAAHRLRTRGHAVKLLEAGAVCGGRVGRRRVRGMQFNAGARLIYAFSAPVNALLAELGLSASLIPIGHLIAGCEGPGERWTLDLMPGLRSLLTPGLTLRERLAFLRFGVGLLARRRSSDPDDATCAAQHDNETLAAFVTRTLGPNVLERMIDPVFRGTRAWNAEEVSPSFFLSTTAHLINGSSPHVLAGGMDQLPRALARDLDCETGVRALSVSSQGPGPCRVVALRDGVEVHHEADIVVSAIEGDKVPALMPDLPAADADFFGGVRYNPCGIVHYQVADKALTDEVRFFARSASGPVATYQQTPADPAQGLSGQIYAQLTPEAAALAGRDGSTAALHALTDSRVRELYPALDRTCTDRHSQWIARMLPTFYPGYGIAMRTFRDRRSAARQRVYFCGDYLGQALLTGAMASGLRAARQIEADWR